jgi:hypothetical protein
VKVSSSPSASGSSDSDSLPRLSCIAGDDRLLEAIRTRRYDLFDPQGGRICRIWWKLFYLIVVYADPDPRSQGEKLYMDLTIDKVAGLFEGCPPAWLKVLGEDPWSM